MPCGFVVGAARGWLLGGGLDLDAELLGLVGLVDLVLKRFGFGFEFGLLLLEPADYSCGVSPVKRPANSTR